MLAVSDLDPGGDYMEVYTYVKVHGDVGLSLMHFIVCVLLQYLS